MNKALLLIGLFLSTCGRQPSNGWTELFNGRDLEGWEVIQGFAPFEAEQGVIVGTAIAGSPNTFLRTREEYADFVLEFEVQVDSLLNSGVQFRSRSEPDYRAGVVHGYQAEIDPSPRSWSGGIYEEQGRGWLVNLQDKPSAQGAFQRDEWNRYRVEAFGDRITIWVNGVATAHLIDPGGMRTGFVALQIHSIKDSSLIGRRVRWRNLRIATSGRMCSPWENPLEPHVARD